MQGTTVMRSLTDGVAIAIEQGMTPTTSQSRFVAFGIQ